jgi:5-methylcytosine-specific restriction endonuclease McrA
MTVKEWVKQKQARHPVCACGCGQKIIIKPQHHWEGIPDYIRGHQPQNQKGENAPNWKGGKVKCICKCGCGKAFFRKSSEVNKEGNFYSYKCKGKWESKNRKGDKCPSWKGGITSLYKQIRACDKYEEWRKAIFARDNYTCQDCGGNTGGNLTAHHEKEFAKILQENHITTLEQALACKELWDINNGRTLCEDCHIEEHTKKAFSEGEQIGFIKGRIYQKQLDLFKLTGTK